MLECISFIIQQAILINSFLIQNIHFQPRQITIFNTVTAPELCMCLHAFGIIAYVHTSGFNMYLELDMCGKADKVCGRGV